MVFPNKTFYWPRHIAIAFVLLTFINLLVIFAPNILGIFGVIGRFLLLLYSILKLYLNCHVISIKDAKSNFFAGATSAPCLIFIFPAVFYIRIVPKEDEPSFSVPKVLVSNLCIRVNRQRKAEKKIKMMWKQLWGLLVGRQTPAVMSVGPLSLSLFQAACFAGIGFLFMIMSLSFIIIDWTSGSSNASSGH